MVKEIKYNDLSININLDELSFIDGFASLLGVIVKDNKYEVITGVIDEKFNVTVPFRKEIVSFEDFNNNDYKNDVLVYKNKRALYKVDDEEYYIINLDNVEFKEFFGKIIPKNPIRRINDYYGVDENKVILYSNGDSCLYDIVNSKVLSKVYDHIIYDDENNKYIGYYFFDNDYFLPSNIQIIFDDNIISNEAIVNYELECLLPNSVIDDKQKIIEYCDECYNSYIKSLNKKENKRMLIQ